MIDVVIATKEGPRNRSFLGRSIPALNDQGIDYHGYLVPTEDGLCAEYARSQGWTVNPSPNPERNMSVAFNEGVAAGTGGRVLLLSDDAYLRPGALRAMMHHDAALVGCLHYQHGFLNHAGGGFRDQHPVHLGRRGEPPHGCQEVEWFSMAVALFDRSVWEQVGGMDEEFGWAYNDVDLCLRAREARPSPDEYGWHSVVCVDAAADHCEAGTRELAISPEMMKRWSAEWIDSGRLGRLRSGQCAVA